MKFLFFALFPSCRLADLKDFKKVNEIYAKCECNSVKLKSVLCTAIAFGMYMVSPVCPKAHVICTALRKLMKENVKIDGNQEV